ncbi:MAG: response regulator transcription factor [Chitinophagaceae bacterium]|nr:response regulator transcription factor [Chitinophagaceae bacterium]
MEKKLYRIIIAEDHPFFVQGLINTVNDFGGYEIVAQTGSGDELMHLIGRNRPDLILLDINLPGKDGLQLTEEIRKQYPAIKVVLLTMYLPSEIKVSLDNIKADAYLLKNSGSETLKDALDSVLAGEKYIDPNIHDVRISNNDSFANQAKLSSREKEILKLLVGGMNNAQISEKLFLSEFTIKTHRKNIMQKLDAHNLAELMRKSGIV